MKNRCDVSNREEVIGVAEKVQKEVGDVTILINNAGIVRVAPFLEQTSEDIQRTINTNMMSNFWTLQAFLPAMVKKNYGHIVAMSSISALMGGKHILPYSASKFAVRGIMESLCYDLHNDPNCQIKTTSVYSSIAHTNLFDIAYLNKVRKHPKLWVLMNPEYVAKCIMDAQRRDVFEVTVPRYIFTVFYLMRLLPVRAIIAIHNWFMD